MSTGLRTDNKDSKADSGAGIRFFDYVRGAVRPLAGPGACCTRPNPESRPGSFRPLRGQSLDSRTPAPNRDHTCPASCGASRMISAPQPRIAAMPARPLAGPGACCTRPNPESQPCLPGLLRGRELAVRVPAPNRDRQAFAPCGASRLILVPRPRIAARKLSPLAGPVA